MTPPARTIAGPVGIDQRLAATMPPTDDNAPNKAETNLYFEILVLTFLAAAAGMMTKEPINNVPATFNPKATVSDIKIKKIKFVLPTDIFKDPARSFDSMLISKLRFINKMVVIIATVDAAVINRSVIPTRDISPNNASKSSGLGVSSKPIAKLKVKNIPTNVSDGNSVFFSRIQIPKVAINKAANAPKNGLKLNNNAKAMPGRAT